MGMEASEALELYLNEPVVFAFAMSYNKIRSTPSSF